MARKQDDEAPQSIARNPKVFHTLTRSDSAGRPAWAPVGERREIPSHGKGRHRRGYGKPSRTGELQLSEIQILA